MSELRSTITLSHSLATDPRTHLEAWLEDVETQARHQCPQHDITGALSLVVPDIVWNMVPGNITNVAGVAQGDPPQFRARPTWDMPAVHANNAAAAVVSIYREETTKHRDYSQASSALTTALLDSVGEANRTLLRTAFPALKPYMLTPRQVVDTMCLKHGVASSDDVSALKEPLSRALTSLSNLTSHMDSFLLASQRLTRSGQGETDFSYFKTFLETVSGFPSIALAMPGYYLTYPAILQQSLATLFPYLETLRDHLVRSDTASPFSGAATQRNRRPLKKKGKQQQQQQQQKPQQQQQQQQHTQNRYPKWGPNGPVAFTATPPATTIADVTPYVAEIQRLTTAMATMGSSPGYDAHSGMLHPPTPPANAHMASSGRPRPFYCWLHGWNNTHNGAQCNIMGANQEYTQQMKSATTPNGTGGNPKIGVPVWFYRSSSDCFRFSSSSFCCLSSSSTPSLPPLSSQASGPISAPLLPAAPVLSFASCMHTYLDLTPENRAPLLDKSNDILLSMTALANEDIRAPALPAALLTSEAQNIPCVRKGMGNTLGPSRSLSWSSPLVTAAHAPLFPDPSDAFISPSRSTHQQDRIRKDIRRQDKTRPKQTRPTTVSPTTPSPCFLTIRPPQPFLTPILRSFPPRGLVGSLPCSYQPFLS